MAKKVLVVDDEKMIVKRDCVLVLNRMAWMWIVRTMEKRSLDGNQAEYI